MTYTEALLINAVFQAESKYQAWWNEDNATRIVFDAVLRGWIRRPSTTQIEWTEAGCEAYKLAIGK